MGRLYATYGVEQSTQTTRFHMNDWLGSRRVDLSPAAVATLTCFNYPYGDGLSCSGPDTDITEQHFTGKMRDAETGNDDFGARYYASNMGRFLTADEFRNDAHLANPQSWNLYAYVHNSPLTLIDPTGEYVEGDGEPKCYEDDAEAKGEQKAGDSQQTRQFVLTDPALLTFAAEGTAQQQNNQAVGNTTEGDLAKTMTHEDGSLSTPKKGDPDVLADAKEALANTIINNAELTKPGQVATPDRSASAQDAQIMGDAVANRATGGADPVEGRTQFGTTHNRHVQWRNAGNHRKGEAGRETVYEKFGPFKDSTSRRPTWIVIYNNPGQ
jgi:RHS repeat-associated protein